LETPEAGTEAGERPSALGNFLPRSNLTELVQIPESLQTLASQVKDRIEEGIDKLAAKIDGVEPGKDGTGTAQPRSSTSGGATESAEKAKAAVAAVSIGAGVAAAAATTVGAHAEKLIGEVGSQLQASVPRYFLASRSYAQFRIPDVPVMAGLGHENDDVVMSAASGAGSAVSGMSGALGNLVNGPTSHLNTHAADTWDRSQFPDFRAQSSSIRGPLVCFGPPEKNTLYVLHFNGFLYEVKMQVDGEDGQAVVSGGAEGGAPPSSPGPKEAVTSSRTQLLCAHTWFASHSDFQMSSSVEPPQEEEGEWQLI